MSLEPPSSILEIAGGNTYTIMDLFLVVLSCQWQAAIPEGREER